MLALIYDGPNHVRAKNKPEPGLEHPNDIILRVTRTAICGSDLHLLHGLSAPRTNFVSSMAGRVTRHAHAHT